MLVQNYPLNIKLVGFISQGSLASLPGVFGAEHLSGAWEPAAPARRGGGRGGEAFLCLLITIHWVCRPQPGRR